MKKIIYSSFAVAAIALISFTGLKGEKISKLNLDKEGTKLAWLGKYVSDGHTHSGTVSVTKGNLELQGDKIISGDFTVDMKTMINEDLPAEKKDYLMGHLASADFFNVEKYSEVGVKVVSQKENTLELELTVLGKKIPATFPYTIKTTDNGKVLSGKFSVDFGALGVNGFKAAEGKPADQRVDTKVDFDLTLALKK